MVDTAESHFFQTNCSASHCHERLLWGSYRNAINIGLPIIECKEASERIEEGDTVEIDFDNGMIYNKTKNESYKGQAFPEFIQKIIKAEGLINYINTK